MKHLAALPKLTQLRLVGADVTDAAIPDLKKLVLLTDLDLKGTKVSPAGVKELAAALPNCWIRSADGKTNKPPRK